MAFQIWVMMRKFCVSSEGLWLTSNRLRYLSWTVTYHFCILIFMIRENRSGIQIELREYNRDHCEPGGTNTESSGHILTTVCSKLYSNSFIYVYIFVNSWLKLAIAQLIIQFSKFIHKIYFDKQILIGFSETNKRIDKYLTL